MKGIIDLLDEIEDILENSSTVPFTSKVMIDKQDLIDIITDIRIKLPGEVKQSKWVVEERNKIIVDAQKEADELIKNSNAKIDRLVNEHEITKAAKEVANQLVEEARYTAKEMRLGALEYADEVLSTMEKTIRASMEDSNAQIQNLYELTQKVMEASKDSIQKQAEKNKQIFDDNLEAIYENRQKLRG